MDLTVLWIAVMKALVVIRLHTMNCAIKPMTNATTSLVLKALDVFLLQRNAQMLRSIFVETILV